MLLSISKADQKAILSFLSDTPPLTYWEDCDTEDRKIHFKKHKAFYTCLRDYLEAYFSEESRKITEKFLGFQERVLFICHKNRSKRDNLAQALKELKAAKSPIDSEILKLWHPKQKAQGYSLVKGVKKRGSSQGGTYK